MITQDWKKRNVRNTSRS